MTKSVSATPKPVLLSPGDVEFKKQMDWWTKLMVTLGIGAGSRFAGAGNADRR
jgi:hypothetical protein